MPLSASFFSHPVTPDILAPQHLPTPSVSTFPIRSFQLSPRRQVWLGMRSIM